MSTGTVRLVTAGNRPALTLARYRLLGAELPPVEETLSLGEMARRYLQGIYGRLNGGAASPVLSGRATDGSRLAGHRHAFYLPSDEDGDGRIDHLTVYAWGPVLEDGSNGGFSQRELRALDQFTQLRQLGRRPDLRLVLLDLSRPADSTGSPLIGPSPYWRSATPFVPPRHQKFRGSNRENPPEQLISELERRSLPAPEKLRYLTHCPLNGASLPWSDFRRQRLQGKGDRGQGYVYGFDLEFSQPVLGPLALGYGCHFGLGLFFVATLVENSTRAADGLQQRQEGFRGKTGLLENMRQSGTLDGPMGRDH